MVPDPQPPCQPGYPLGKRCVDSIESMNSLNRIRKLKTRFCKRNLSSFLHKEDGIHGPVCLPLSCHRMLRVGDQQQRVQRGSPGYVRYKRMNWSLGVNYNDNFQLPYVFEVFEHIYCHQEVTKRERTHWSNFASI